MVKQLHHVSDVISPSQPMPDSFTEPALRVINAFSSFYAIGERQQFKTLTDPKNRRLIEPFTQQIQQACGQVFAPDHWAKYFLITFYFAHRDCPQARQVELKKLAESGSAELRDWVRHIQQLHADESVIALEYLWQTFNIWELQPPAPNNTSTSTVEALLQAYLQHSSRYAAQRFYGKYLDGHAISSKYSLEDCFAQTSQWVLHPAPLLQSFKFGQGNKVRTYTEGRLMGLLKDRISRSNDYFRISGLSPQGLLKQTSLKKVKEAFTFQGYSDRDVRHHKLILSTFQELYFHKQSGPNTRLPEPSQQELKRMSDRYNQRCDEFKLTPIDTSQFSTELKQLNQVIRQYYKAVYAPQEVVPRALSGEDTDTNYPIDLISDEALKSQPDQWLDAEGDRELSRQVQASLVQGFQTLTDQQQAIVHLSYGLDFTTTEIAKILGVNQATVSRQLGKIRQSLFANILQNLQSILAASSGCVIQTFTNWMEQIVGEWLDEHSHDLLEQSWQDFCTLSNPIQAELDQLTQQFQAQLEQDLNLKVPDSDRASTRLKYFIERQLE